MVRVTARCGQFTGNSAFVNLVPGETAISGSIVLTDGGDSLASLQVASSKGEQIISVFVPTFMEAIFTLHTVNESIKSSETWTAEGPCPTMINCLGKISYLRISLEVSRN